MARKNDNAADSGELDAHRSYLLRYALIQLRDPVIAEDVVQETLLAAVEGQDRFSGKSAVRTWLTGILKHKIVDHLRRQNRERPLIDTAGDPDSSEADAIDALFVKDGHWRNRPADWGDPDRAFENKAFWEVFETCAKLMPAKTARVFAMREVMDMSTDEICKALDITPTNCWVMLHRARLSLRECLEFRWFGKS